MNSSGSPYTVQTTPSTTAVNAVLCGLISLFGNQPLATTPTMQQPTRHSYTVIERGKTHSQYPNNLLGIYEPSSLDFESFMMDFYANLLMKQKPLEKEFQDILADNLWDLYVRS